MQRWSARLRLLRRHFDLNEYEVPRTVNTEEVGILKFAPDPLHITLYSKNTVAPWQLQDSLERTFANGPTVVDTFQTRTGISEAIEIHRSSRMTETPTSFRQCLAWIRVTSPPRRITETAIGA